MKAADKAFLYKLVLSISIGINVLILVLYVIETYLPQKAHLKATNETWHVERKALFQQLTIDTQSICLIGNSIIERFPAQEMLGSLRIKNRGIAGELSSGIFERCRQTAAYRPAKMFIESSLNDLFNNVAPNTILAQLSSTLDTIAAISPSTQVYLLTMLPASQFAEKVSQYNRQLQALCKQKNIPCIEVGSKLLDPQTGTYQKAFTTDGIHLSGAGYRAFSDVLKPFIVE